VLLFGDPSDANRSLAAWLGERELISVAGPATTTLADQFKPDVVLLDFHGLPVPTGHTVSLLKDLSPAPLVIVLTHDGSAAMQRRCRERGVDAVFDKTTELEAIERWLENTRVAIAASRADGRNATLV
jgi:DNA-binding NarL/FixJ family response regulator